MSVAVVTSLMAACSPKPGAPRFDEAGAAPDVAGNTAPTAATAAIHHAVADTLPLSDPQDFEDAKRGLIASDPALRVMGPEGEPIWDMPAYEFIEGPAPPSVNPSLWRQAKLNNIHGLFEVTRGVHQLRGFDLANMTLIEGHTGWIVVDPLTAEETARAAIAFARTHLGERQVSAVIFTHSHVDHFGGVLGVLSADEAKARGIPIIAPEHFVEEATSENILAGLTMARRSLFMFGPRLPRGERGHVGSGLGKGPAYGTVGLLEPTVTIDATPTELTVDGVRFIFQNAPGSEAPSELTFYLPDIKTFCGAEIVSHTMHNLYTLRGAKVRDALRWSAYIDEIIQLFGEAETYFGSHHWPIWGNARILDFLEKQRDTYKFIHDQTMRLALMGLTPTEIAERLELPEVLRTSFPNRGYYGTLKHNAKAVYQRYFGWYDGNPANLDPLPPEEAGPRYVELAGGAANVMSQAQAAFDRGEYRWAAELLNHLVFADPSHGAAKALLANTYDQLGYRAESGPWRDVYLNGALELRHGGPDTGVDLATALDMLRHAPLGRFFDSLAARLDPVEAAGKRIKINVTFTDIGESYVLDLDRSVLRHYPRAPDEDANATLKITQMLFVRMLTGEAGLKDTLFGDELEVEGSALDLLGFFRLFDKPEGTFNVVTP